MSTPTVSARELTHNFAAIAARVAAGETMLVTRHGKPLMQLSAPESGRLPEARDLAALRAEMVARLEAFRLPRSVGKFDRNECYERD